MSNLGPPLTLIGILLGGLALCWLGDVIRRRTAGRIRHAEIHLLAWIPTLLLEGVLLWAAGSPGSPRSSTIYLSPLVFAGFVYLYWLGKTFRNRAWERSEEQLDKGDAQWLEERRRRERIESYKHKGSVRRDTQR